MDQFVVFGVQIRNQTIENLLNVLFSVFNGAKKKKS